MNTLQIIRDRQVKYNRLSEAQKLMAKAYRGIEYIDANHLGTKPQRPTDLSYRGISYSIA